MGACDRHAQREVPRRCSSVDEVGRRPVAEAREVVLAFRSFPAEHWRKIWSTNPLERLNKEIKRRTRVVGIFRKDAAISRLVGGLLLEQQEEWQLEGGRVFSELSMAKLDSSNDPGQDIPYAALAAAA